MKGSSKQGSNEAYQGKHVVQSQASASNGYTPIQQGEVVVDGTVLQKQRDKKPFIIAAASVIAASFLIVTPAPSCAETLKITVTLVLSNTSPFLFVSLLLS